MSFQSEQVGSREFQPLARRERGVYPERSLTSEQQRQRLKGPEQRAQVKRDSERISLASTHVHSKHTCLGSGGEAYSASTFRLRILPFPQIANQKSQIELHHS